jgi:L-threonylcarbamoyladenylate synthase
VLACCGAVVNQAYQTRVLSTHDPALFEMAVAEAASALRAGELVALPTETVYGLAANALDPQAVARIYEVKGRPAQNPIIVHVADLEQARRCVAAWPEAAARLARAFWPGPLTLVLPRAVAIPDVVTNAGPTVGVRWPRHPFIQAVIRACGFPLAAPSANLSTQVSPTTVEHVLKTLAGRIPLIVDGGPAQVGIESTVIDLAVVPPRVLRPGMIHATTLEAVLGPLASGIVDVQGECRSPGLMEKHYAPAARLLVLTWKDESDLARQIELFTGLARSRLTNDDRAVANSAPPSATFILAHTVIPSSEKLGRVSVIPRDAEAFGRALYAELHRCDEQGAQWIVVESVPDTPEWTAIADRLRRAATV